MLQQKPKVSQIKKLNISIKTLGLLILLCSGGDCLAQTRKRILLRDNHIKKILTFTQDEENGQRYLSRISFVNDSGLIYRSAHLNSNQDTISRSFSKYDEINRETFSKTVYGPDSLVTYSHEYPADGSVKTSISFFGHESIDFEKAIKKGRKETYHYYTNDKLQQTVIYKKKKHFFKVSVKNEEEKDHKTKSREYFDTRGNAVKTVGITRSRRRVEVGGYTITDGDGKIEKDRKKYKTLRQKEVRVRTFEYDSNNFRTKEIYHSSPDKPKARWRSTGQSYLCYTYEYLKE